GRQPHRAMQQRDDDDEGTKTSQPHTCLFFPVVSIVLQSQSPQHRPACRQMRVAVILRPCSVYVGDQPLNMLKRRSRIWAFITLLLAVVAISATSAVCQQQPLPDAPKPQNNAPAAPLPDV